MSKIIHPPAPYEPCYCPLGQKGNKYKFCHYPIDSAPAENRRELSQKAYIQKWENNADYFRGQGCYAWMSSLMAKHSPQRILDVGCGNGDGILAMKAACPNAKIISCDDNAACLTSARNKIEPLGLSVEVIHRLHQSAAGEKYHEMRNERGLLKTPPAHIDFSLIHADIIWDIEFKDFLKSLTKFDAITVWLMGTYDLKPQCKNIGGMTSEGHYRLKVQNSLYELADKILRHEGVLQVVDRFRYKPDANPMEIIVQSHQEQASVTSLEFIEYQSRDYLEPTDANSTPMIATEGGQRKNMEDNRLGMSSVISIKR